MLGSYILRRLKHTHPHRLVTITNFAIYNFLHASVTRPLGKSQGVQSVNCLSGMCNIGHFEPLCFSPFFRKEGEVIVRLSNRTRPASTSCLWHNHFGPWLLLLWFRLTIENVYKRGILRGKSVCYASNSGISLVGLIFPFSKGNNSQVNGCLRVFYRYYCPYYCLLTYA